MTCKCKNKVKLGVKVISDLVTELPKYQHEGDACFDIRIVIPDGDFVLKPNETHIFGTGLVFDIPKGYMLAVYPRSGLGIKHNIVLANLTGIIDSSYTDELRVGLINMGDKVFTLFNGDRVCQGMLVPVQNVEIEQVEEVNVKERGTDSGLGSSGVK